MLKKIPKSKVFSPYGRYFLASEAPGDEENTPPGVDVEEEEPTELDPDMDFNSLGDEEDLPLEDDTNDVPDQDPDMDFNSLGDDDDVEEPDMQADENPSDSQDSVEDTTQPDNDSPDDNVNDTADNQDTGEEGTEMSDDSGDRVEVPPEEGAEQEPTGDENFNDMSDETSDLDSSSTDDSDTGGDKKGPGLEYDSTRKYTLFKEYLSLYNAIDNYISKFENNIRDNREMNQVLKVATNLLREIKDLCYDYMTMKFEVSSYVQSLIFYQKLVISIQIIFKMIADVQKRQKTNLEEKH